MMTGIGLGLVMKRQFSTTFPVKAADFTHTVIGAGVVGLAVAAELVVQSPKNKVLVIEKNAEYGMETSSRNSEVVHAGLYYPIDSLKTRMCIRGKELIYEKKEFFPVKQCGKWIIAQNDTEMEYLYKLHDKAKALGVPTEFLTSLQCSKLEPRVKAKAGALHSPTTGITSAHGLMDYLSMKIQAGPGMGDLVFGTKVVNIEHDKGKSLYEINTSSQSDDGDCEEFVFTSNAVINCAGLYSAQIANMVLPETAKIEMHYAKGNYFSYSGPSLGIQRLIYPTPSPNLQGLGTHLTIDLGGQVRFGPDVEWLSRTSNDTNFEDQFDYKVNNDNLQQAAKAVTKYLPDIKVEQLHGSYSGIRPKLAAPGAGFEDFLVREESEHGLGGFVNMIGIESPGLTSSMALAEHVVKSYFK